MYFIELTLEEHSKFIFKKMIYGVIHVITLTFLKESNEMGFKILKSRFGALDVLGVLSSVHYGGDTAS